MIDYGVSIRSIRFDEGDASLWMSCNLKDLRSGKIPGISRQLGGSLAEASGVCLESEGHAQGVQLTVRGDVNNRYSVSGIQLTTKHAERGETQKKRLGLRRCWLKKSCLIL